MKFSLQLSNQNFYNSIVLGRRKLKIFFFLGWGGGGGGGRKLEVLCTIDETCRIT